MSKKCGILAIGLGVAAGYIAGKYGDVIVKTVKDSLDKKSVKDLADEIKADSEGDLGDNEQPDWVKDSYIVLPSLSDEEETVDLDKKSDFEFPEFLKKFRKEKEVGVSDLSEDSSLIDTVEVISADIVDSQEEVKEEIKEEVVEKPKKKTTRKPTTKKEVKSEDK